MLDHPYVTAGEFRAHPTYLDSNNLRVAGTQAEQDAALTNALLTASQWADDHLNMPLGAHTRVENSRVTPDRYGRLRYHPEHAPVVQVSGISVGPSPDSLSTVTDPQAWVEQDGRIVVAYLPGVGDLTGLQLPAAAAPLVEQLVQWTYIAGFPATQLAAPAAAGASTLELLDATGVAVGTVLRLWTPGLEEAVTVTALTGTTATIARPLANAHAAGDSCSALPTTARLAVIYYAAASLMRPGPQAQQQAATYHRGGQVNPSASSGDLRRTSGGQQLVADACRLLATFRRIR